MHALTHSIQHNPPTKPNTKYINQHQPHQQNYHQPLQPPNNIINQQTPTLHNNPINQLPPTLNTTKPPLHPHLKLQNHKH
ncbi:hypothetical protein, partial [Staphylococcus aureus]|uniref:hypothetical protein n=1 Tax=Staphylococcus aureus TaxID=1280 RepID=UPI0037DA604C